MSLPFNFVTDRIVNDKIYPAFSQWSATPYTPGWRLFAHHWPNTVPFELLEHCRTHNYPCSISTNGPGFYAIVIGFFNFAFLKNYLHCCFLTLMLITLN